VLSVSDVRQSTLLCSPVSARAHLLLEPPAVVAGAGRGWLRSYGCTPAAACTSSRPACVCIDVSVQVRHAAVPSAHARVALRGAELGASSVLGGKVRHSALRCAQRGKRRANEMGSAVVRRRRRCKEMATAPLN